MMTILFIAYIIASASLLGAIVIKKGEIGVININHNPILTALTLFGFACVVFPTQTDFVSKMIMHVIR